MKPHTFFSGKEIRGEGSSSTVIISQEKLEYLFTATQLHELQTQILFLKHIESGYPLPLPIWSCMYCFQHFHLAYFSL
ncbi:hypothetical protein Leryth_025316 [Lithospermum erythrorhizon]|nr:hypothetical protein Leryth_025316 [Lithospermum erythrorhizon]